MVQSILIRERDQLIEELDLLKQWKKEDFIQIIQNIGFSCTGCAQCCNTGFNGHVFLLDEDVDRALKLCPDALIPAPFFEVCDNNGRYYVSGYALRAGEDKNCIFLRDGRCTIYEDRFSICRVYPYMLHREPDSRGKIDFRQFSGLDLHGEYHQPVSIDEVEKIADITLHYEEAWFSQMITFYSELIRLFDCLNLRPVRKIYDKGIADLRKGTSETVNVWHRGRFNEIHVKKEDYVGFDWL